MELDIARWIGPNMNIYLWSVIDSQVLILVVLYQVSDASLPAQQSLQLVQLCVIEDGECDDQCSSQVVLSLVICKRLGQGSCVYSSHLWYKELRINSSDASLPAQQSLQLVQLCVIEDGECDDQCSSQVVLSLVICKRLGQGSCVYSSHLWYKELRINFSDASLPARHSLQLVQLCVIEDGERDDQRSSQVVLSLVICKRLGQGSRVMCIFKPPLVQRIKGEVQSRITIILKESIKLSLQIGAKMMKIG